MYNKIERPINIMPTQWLGDHNFECDWTEMHWLKDLPQNTFFALWLKIPSLEQPIPRLPPGHPLYVVCFLDEPLDHKWLIQEANKTSAPIIVLNDGWIYNLPVPENVFFYQFHSWHHQIEQICSWFPNKQILQPKYKVSAICNRITQSKLIIFTAIMQFIQRDLALVRLSNWLEEKNVHHRALTGDPLLDELQTRFFDEWLGKDIKIDDFDNAIHNQQRFNSNPWQPLYTNAAVHFTNESYHYSFMDDELGQYIRPGPCLSEKTYSCLASGTAFISVAQYDVYRSLEQLGFQFNYGDIDLSWDQDPGNLSRLKSIVECVKYLGKMDLCDIVAMTKHSHEHNIDHIWSGRFSRICQEKNAATADLILRRFG
jgi:hypothetical protein